MATLGYVCLISMCVSYGTNHPQLKQYTHHTRKVNHTRMGFLDSTHVYMRTQYLHMRVFTRVYVCMANVAS